MAAILIVDDDPDVIRILRVAFGLAGHEVVATADATKAVPLAAAAGVKAAVLDISLPSGSGFDMLQALRAHPRTADVPAIFLSAHRAAVERLRGLQAGADDYVTKPFDAPEVVLRVERLLAAAARRRPAPPDDEAAKLKEALTELEARRARGAPLGESFIGRYLVLDVLGEGGMGTVYRGWDPKLQRALALKTIRPDPSSVGADRSEMVHRLLLEAIMVAQVSHPNIVAVFDVGDASDVGFIAMELVDGVTLQRHLTRLARLAPDQAVVLAAGICRGLAAAHDNRLVHHDVKPGNVLLARGGAIKVTDFGVAELMSSWVRDSRMIYGTPGYLPPETLRGHGYDERGDVFAAGVILWQCIAGSAPFAADTPEATARRTLHLALPRLSSLAPGVPAELDALMELLLCRDPARRLASAAEAAERLEHMAWSYGWRWRPDIRPVSGSEPQSTGHSRLMRALDTPTPRT